MREGWEIKKLGEICDVSAGQGAPQGNDKYSPTGTPFVKAGDLSGLLKGQTEKDILQVSADIIKSHRLKVYPAGALLFAKSGMSCMKGYVYTLKHPCCVVSHLAILTPKGSSSSYLQYCLRHIKPNTLVKDPAYPSISLADISSMCIPVPQIQEQEKIVAELDCLSGVIEKKKQQLEELDNLAQSIFYDMFGNPITNEKGFPKLTIDDVIAFQGGSQPAKTYFEYEPTENNIRLIQTRDYKTDNYITYIPKALARRFCTKDDIMIGRYGPPIFQILRGLEGAYNVALMKATPKMGNREFIRAFLQQKCLLHYLENFSQRVAGQDGIQMDKLKSYPFPYPPIDLQNAFAQKIEAIEKQKELIKKSIQETETLFNSRMDYWFN